VSEKPQPDPRRDEPVNIDLEPEEEPKAIMETRNLPEYSVHLRDAEAGDRVFDWRGKALEDEGARQAALDAWAKHYGDRPNTYALIRRIDRDALVPQHEPNKKQGDELAE
jgi:hypothetical protein